MELVRKRRILLRNGLIAALTIFLVLFLLAYQPLHQDLNGSNSKNAQNRSKPSKLDERILRELRVRYAKIGEMNSNERKKIFKRACEKYKDIFSTDRGALYSDDIINKTAYYSYFKFKNRTISVCDVHKVGSNTLWHRLKDIGVVHMKDCVNSCIEDSDLRIIQVRNPMERIASAYRVFFKEGSWSWYGWEDENFEKLKALENITFPEFVNNFIIGQDNRGDWNYTSLGLENVEWVRAHKIWMPYWLRCGGCQERFRPDIIMNTETLDNDHMYLLWELGVSLANFEAIKIRPGSPNVSISVGELYRQLNRNQVEAIYQKYHPDFEMYGYSPQEYFEYSNSSISTIPNVV